MQWFLVLSLLSLPIRTGLDTTQCAEPAHGRDTIFVERPDREGVYTQQLGTVVDVRVEDLTLVTDSAGFRTIYSREIVRRIGLDTAHCKALRDQVASYWNKTKSRLVGSVQRFPFVGAYLGFLDGLPGGLDVFLAMLLLLAVLGYGAYRAYDTLIVAREVRELNHLKLRMEVDKLRYELDAVKERVAAVSPPAAGSGRAASAAQQSAPAWRAPEIRGMEFLQYKVMRLPSEEERQLRREDWAERWNSYRAKRAWLPAVLYAWWRLLNSTASLTVAFMGLAALVDVALPLTAPAEYADTPAGVMLMFATVGILCLSAFLRLRVSGQMIKQTYRDFRRAG